jgi:hypothetical protein
MPKSGYRSLTIREETARRLEALANTKRIGIVELVERYADAVELITLQEAAVSIAFEDKLTKIWHRLHYVEKSLPGFYKLRDSLLRDGQDVPLFNELTDVIDVRAKIERLLNESYPKWYQNVNQSELSPYIFNEHHFFLPQFEGPLSESQQKFLKSQRQWFIKMKKGELKRVIRDFAENLDGCFDNIEELKNILPDAPLVRALEDIVSPLKKTRKALNVLV